MKPPRAKMGFSLIEVLVVLGLVTVLSGITVASMRQGRQQQILEFAAARVQRTLEFARALAMAEGVPVHFVVAWSDMQPPGAAFKGYALYRGGDPNDRIQPWHLLPKEIHFAADPREGAGDLWLDPGFADLAVGGGAEDTADGISGTARVWVVAKPDGRFYAGAADQAVPAHLALVRGRGHHGGGGVWSFDPASPRDAVRVRLRPLSGLTRQERIDP